MILRSSIFHDYRNLHLWMQQIIKKIFHTKWIPRRKNLFTKSIDVCKIFKHFQKLLQYSVSSEGRSFVSSKITSQKQTGKHINLTGAVEHPLVARYIFWRCRYLYFLHEFLFSRPFLWFSLSLTHIARSFAQKHV